MRARAWCRYGLVGLTVGVAAAAAVVWNALPVVSAFAAGCVTTALLAKLGTGRAGHEVGGFGERLAASVSHEFRTPLSVIVAATELLLEEEAGPTTATQRTFLLDIERAAQRLRRLVEDLTLIALIDAGRFQLHPTKVSVSEIVRTAVDWNRVDAETKRVELLTEIREPEGFSADGSRLIQVIDNLISNAVKFTPPDGRVTVRAGPDRGGGVLIEVSDTGIGVPVDDRQRIFLRHYRGAAAESEMRPGAGMGLTIVKAVIEAHGGRVEVSEAEGGGARFLVQIPSFPADKLGEVRR